MSINEQNKNTAFDINNIEQALNENKKLAQILMEEQRYKQQCRLRALDLAFNEPRKNMSELNQIRTTVDILPMADKYYNWLIKIPSE